MIISVSAKNWEKEIEEQQGVLKLTDSEVSKLKASLKARLVHSKRLPQITEADFDQLTGKVMCIQLTGGSKYLLARKQGCLHLSLED